MAETYQIAVVGDWESVMGFRALGLDTYPVTFAAYLRLALADFGYSAPEAEVMEKMLVNTGHAVSYYTEQYHLPQLRERYKYYQAKGAVAMPETLPQVKDVLQRVRELGGVNCIYTHRDGTVFPMLEHGGLTELFDEIITPGHEGFATKPAPDAVLYLMEKYSTAPEETVIVGDRACDLESGQNAGCRTLHLLTPAVPQYPPCDWRIENFGQMLEMLK